MKNLILILAITTLLFSCKKEEKVVINLDNTETLKTTQDTARIAITEIEEPENPSNTIVYFETFSVEILGFKSHTDENSYKTETDTISITDESDGWGMSDKKLKIKANNKDWKFDIEYCFTENLRVQNNNEIVWKGKSGYQKITKTDNHNFLLPEFSEIFYTKCHNEIQQKLNLKDTLVEYEYSNAKLAFKGKPVLLEPTFLILKIKLTDTKGNAMNKFLKIEVYEGGC